MKNQIAIVLIALTFSVTLPAQISPLQLKGKYLGQKPPGMTAELFAPGVISTKYYEHSAAVFSPDGKTVLWTVIYERGKPARMMEMKMENKVWTKSAAPTFADTTADDFYPSFSVDGKMLYFSSRRKIPGEGSQPGGLRIWQVPKTKSGWGQPIPMDTSVFQPEDYAHSITANGTIYTSFRRQNGRVFDLAAYRKKGDKYQKSEPLPYNINTLRSEDGAFIAPDESYLLFESSRPGGMEGSTDLYVSFKKKDGSWTLAKNMGPAVNSNFTERFPRVSPDGKYLFFGSDRNLPPGAEGTDVYWVDAKVIDQLKTQILGENEKSIDLEGQDILPVLYSNDLDKAASRLKTWLRAHPKDIGANLDYFSVLRRSQQFARAEEEMKQLPADLLDHKDLKVESALIKYSANHDEEAAEIIATLPTQGLENRSRLITLASALYNAKKYRESGALYQLALNIQPRGLDFYNMACSYSLAADKDKAFDALQKAADHGYHNKGQIENDGDLTFLKSDSRWSSLLQKLDAPFETATPYKRAHHEMVFDAANKAALLVGGSTPMNGGQWYKFFNDVWRYDASGWNKMGNVGDERSGIRLAYDSKHNQIYSFGGFTADNQTSGMLRVLENGAWRIISNEADMKAAEAGFVYDMERDKFIAFGGSADRGTVNGITWEWDRTEWKKIEGPGPEARQAFAMVYDTKRKITVLFGGVGSSPQQLGDTWEFDGKTWTRVAENGPGGRLAPGYAYDSKRGQLVLFGGIANNEFKGDTWAWDGSNWKKLADNGPSPRGLTQMVYDPNRDRIILFGGRLGASDADDTWEWDGMQWREVKRE